MHGMRVVLVLAVLVASCGGGDGAPDANHAADAAVVRTDGGGDVSDASHVHVPDASVSEADAGVTAACGAHGQDCCDGDACGHQDLSCISGVCQGACGSAGAPCCGGLVCTALNTTCRQGSLTCESQTVLTAFSLCTDDPDETCPAPTWCTPSRLDTRANPPSICTVDCTSDGDCHFLGTTGACVHTAGGQQCHQTCDNQQACPSGFGCMEAPGELGNRWVCVPGAP